MGLFDRFKTKTKAPEKKPAKKEQDVLPARHAKQGVAGGDMVKEAAPAGRAGDQPKEAKQPVVLKEDTGLAPRILQHYHLSEKSNALSRESRYVFKVSVEANKIEVKKAIEKVYEVHVTDVNMLNVKGKPRRQGRQFGRTQAWKKAVVTLKPGEKIAGLAEGV